MNAFVIEGMNQHRGRWVAVDPARRKILFALDTRAEVMTLLNEQGVRGALVIGVPLEDGPLVIDAAD